jgi:DNA-binding response OmpR family regulator
MEQFVSAESGHAATAKTKVLVVEDDRASRTALMALLRMTGFEPLPAATVAEGLALLERQPTFVLLDLMLPDGNGSTLLEHVRREQLPISVAVTTGAMEWQKMLEGCAGPPDAMFPKPVDFKRLIEWLNAPAQ